MKAVKRYDEYKSVSFDLIILDIKKNKIRCGRFAHLKKATEDINLKKKGVLFNGK